MNSIQKKAMELYLQLLAKKQAKKGQSLAEYALIIALVAIICMVGLNSLAGGINSQLTKLAGTITGAG